MGELARRRRERDHRLTRSQGLAVGVGVALLICTVGLLAYGVLRRASPSAVVHAEPEQLVDLLARVDAAVVAEDSVDALTFPDTLAGVAPPTALPDLDAVAPEIVLVAAGEVGARSFELVLREELSAADGLASQLRELGWSVQVRREQDGATLRVSGGPNLAAAQAQASRLAVDLKQLERPLAIELRPR